MRSKATTGVSGSDSLRVRERETWFTMSPYMLGARQGSRSSTKGLMQLRSWTQTRSFKRGLRWSGRMQEDLRLRTGKLAVWLVDRSQPRGGGIKVGC